MLVTLITLTNLNSSVNGLNWSANSKDLLLLLVIVISILIHLFILKRDKIFAWLFSIYSSYLIVLFFPFNQWLPQMSLESMVWAKSGGFVVLAIFLAVIFSRAHIFASAFSGFLAKFFQSLVYGILSCGLILSFLCTFLPVEVLSQFSNFSQNIFNKDVARFLWLALPLVFILFSLKFKGHKGPGRPALE
ncbi:MAG TPA: hypothetical protein PLK76_02065 [bacterium]|nr:hypothetical protein [bacterium]